MSKRLDIFTLRKEERKMYIAITDTRVYTAKTLPMLNRSMNGMLEEDEFKQVGADSVVILSAAGSGFRAGQAQTFQHHVRQLLQKRRSSPATLWSLTSF